MGYVHFKRNIALPPEYSILTIFKWSMAETDIIFFYKTLPNAWLWLIMQVIN